MSSNHCKGALVLHCVFCLSNWSAVWNCKVSNDPPWRHWQLKKKQWCFKSSMYVNQAEHRVRDGCVLGLNKSL